MGKELQEDRQPVTMIRDAQPLGKAGIQFHHWFEPFFSLPALHVLPEDFELMGFYRHPLPFPHRDSARRSL